MDKEKSPPTNVWDAIAAFAPAAFVLALCLGIGGCQYLMGKGIAAEKSVQNIEQSK